MTCFRFEQIHEMISDPRVFVCVLIDEVESLTAARKSNSQVRLNKLQIMVKFNHDSDKIFRQSF